MLEVHKPILPQMHVAHAHALLKSKSCDSSSFIQLNYAGFDFLHENANRVHKIYKHQLEDASLFRDFKSNLHNYEMKITKKITETSVRL